MTTLILFIVTATSAQSAPKPKRQAPQPIATSDSLKSVADSVRSQYKDADVELLGDADDSRLRNEAPYLLAHPDPTSKLGKEYLRLLDDPNEVVRAASIMALGLLKEKRSISALRKILHDLPSVKLDQHGQPINGQPPEVTRKEFTFASITSGALITLGDCKSIPEIMKHEITASAWQSLFVENCKSEARKPLEAVAANGSDLQKSNAKRALRFLYGAEK